MRRCIVLFLALFLVTGCETDIRDSLFLDSRIALTVNKITVDYLDNPILHMLPVDHERVGYRAPSTPLEGMQFWVEDNLKAVGGDYTARVGILEAKITKIPEPVIEPFAGWTGLTYEENVRYELRYNVVVEILDPRGFVVASAKAATTRSAAVPGKQDLGSVATDLIDRGVEDINAKLKRNMYHYLELFIEKGPALPPSSVAPSATPSVAPEAG